MPLATTGHKDATGYLLGLQTDIPYDWFSYACDLALVATDDQLDPDDLKKLVSLFLGEESYTARSASTTPAPTTTLPPAPSSTSPLKELCGFTNFKKLASTLQVEFDKRITLIFGTNGSGKSSVCQSMKMLGSPNSPDDPLNNVYSALHSNPSFEYRFDTDSTKSCWDESLGYGAHSSQIKHFDSTIAFSRVNDELHPDTIIEISPFRLEVFDYCRSFVRELRDRIDALVEEQGNKIDVQMASIVGSFVEVDDGYKQTINDLSKRSNDALKEELANFEKIDERETKEYEDATQSLIRLAEASTEQGVKMLKSEAGVIRRLRRSVADFVKRCNRVKPDDFNEAIRNLQTKSATEKTLAEDILPDGVGIEPFKAFLESSNKFFDFDAEELDDCPLCRRPFDDESEQLIQKYHDFLISNLQQEIGDLSQQVRDAALILEGVRDFELDIDDDTDAIISSEDRQAIIKLIDDAKVLIPNPLPKNKVTSFLNFDGYTNLEPFVTKLGQEADKRDEAIVGAQSDSTLRKKKIAKFQKTINEYDYRLAFSKAQGELTKINSLCEARNVLQEMVGLADFSTVLRRMTNAGKDAHTALVVAEFEKSLDKEYEALSGKSLADFGIRLKPRGAQQSVAVETQIGDTPIKRVLSEGEQKIHALAMFFCEAQAQPCDVFVFDDPSTSFDYNHLGFFVERLRDFAKQFPDSQFIIFTHNWDLFVQIQIVFNKARLNNDMDVKVMENCSIIETYSEKVDDLKTQITDVLSLPGDLDKGQKERISGQMRRLIESVVNKRVFNGQRHQFKQRGQSVSVFDEFVKIVPLEPAEAQKLSDLYGHLSVTEHDDPRNSYVSRNKASFQKWYDEITAIESALIGRRP